MERRDIGEMRRRGPGVETQAQLADMGNHNGYIRMYARGDAERQQAARM